MIAAVAVTAALAGCGGSAEGTQTYSVVADTTMTTGDVGKAQFIVHSNQICREGWATVVDNFREYSSWHENGSPQKRFAEAVQLSLLAGIDFHIFDEIYREKAPPGEKEAIEEIIGSLQSAVERGQRRLAPISSIPQVANLFAEYNQHAQVYGLDDCLIDKARLHAIET